MASPYGRPADDGAGMKVVEIREESELEALRPDWDVLLQQSPASSIFLTWEWASAWWSSYGEAGALRILGAFDQQGVLRGIAPLRSGKAARYGQAATTLSFIGDGSNDSDYLDCIVASSHEQSVLEAFHGYWVKQLHRGTALMLNEIPETSANLPWLRAVVSGREMLRKETDVPCCTVNLPQTWEAYLAMLRPRFRTKLRSVLRNWESRSEAEFGFCETPEDADRLLSALFDLHTRRWRQEGKPGVFGWDRKRAFYAKLTRLLLERGWLRFSWLKWKGEVLACQYGFKYADTYSQLQEGYEPAAEHWNPGVGLRAWSIRQFVEQGLREYDFLGGVTRHKTHSGAEDKHSNRILPACETCKNRVVFHCPPTDVRARELIKRLIPKKVLAIRRARLAPQIAAPYGHSHNGHEAYPGGQDWLRKTAASCYYYSPLPRLMRPLPDRYHLSLPTGRA